MLGHHSMSGAGLSSVDHFILDLTGSKTMSWTIDSRSAAWALLARGTNWNISLRPTDWTLQGQNGVFSIRKENFIQELKLCPTMNQPV